MKKKLLLGVAVFGAAAAVNSSALAAAPLYNWTGCYIGVNAGYSWGRASVDGTATGLASIGLPTQFSTGSTVTTRRANTDCRRNSRQRSFRKDLLAAGRSAATGST